MQSSDATQNQVEVPETATDSNQKSSVPKFKSKGEAEAYCLKETGLTLKELDIVQSAPKELRNAYHAFYATMRADGIRMDKISEIQRRDAFLRGYLYAKQSGQTKPAV
jgi:hypothetical protein